MLQTHTTSRESTCRSCGKPDLEPVLSLGVTPLADALRTEKDLDRDEARYPLNVALCRGCSLVQLHETVPPDELFCRDYPYYSSFSDAWLRHNRANAEQLIESRGLGRKSLVLELASNDGYMLRNFSERGIPVLGIDPADGPANVAEANGVPTRRTFFTEELAHELRKEGSAADVVIAKNVLAHVPDLNGFVQGIATILKDDGVTVIEVPYVRDLVDHCEFDTIYHEHLCYFSVSALRELFARHSLSLNRVERHPTHGGSLRLFVGHDAAVDESVGAILDEERGLRVDQSAYYREFAARVIELRESLRSLLVRLKGEGRSIAAYGAAAKGATLINYVGIGPEFIDFVVDRNVHKHGRFMPGQRLQIYPCERLVEVMPDYVLLLAWNFADEIIRQQAAYRDRGGVFIKPVPTPTLIPEPGNGRHA